MTGDKSNMSICLQTLSDDYRKLQLDLSISKLEIITLTRQLVNERESYSAIERNYQRSLQDLEHYKIRKVFEKPTLELNESNGIDYDIKTIFTNNEKIIKNNFELKQNIITIERQLEESNNKCKNLEIELSNNVEKNNNLQSLIEELKSFITEKKSELLELNTLKSRIIELENAPKSDSNNPFLSININKIKELELKCFNLERVNDKLKDNHANLRLLVEENASISNENERLKQRLLEYENANSTKLSDRSFESQSDVNPDRHIRHVERENEILKCQQSQMSEQNTELKSKIVFLERNVSALSQGLNDYQILLHDKEQRIIVQDNEIRCLTKDCQSFKNVLETFTDPAFVDNQASEMLSRLYSLCKSVEDHKFELNQQSVMVDQLVQVIAAHIDNLETGSGEDDVIMGTDNENLDRGMIIELRQEIERLNEELSDRNIEVKHAEDKCRRMAIEVRSARRLDESDDQMSDIGSCDTGVNISNKDRQTKLFKKLSHSMLDTVKQLLGYSLEFGPNGHVTCHNCLSDDPSDVLEFKVTTSTIDNISVEPVLIDNSYSQSIMKQIDYKNYYPSLLASITLDLMERRCNSMC